MRARGGTLMRATLAADLLAVGGWRPTTTAHMHQQVVLVRRGLASRPRCLIFTATSDTPIPSILM
jgi:hypothetical protein